jgi:hypothetical protein
MEWATVWVGVSTFVAGGVFGAAATVYATRKESSDRGRALDLEREKWEYERDQPLRERQKEVLAGAATALEALSDFLWKANKDPARLDAFVGEFHEVRVVAGALHAAGEALEQHDLLDQAEELYVVLDRFDEAVRDWRDSTYHACFEADTAARRSISEKLARIV